MKDTYRNRTLDLKTVKFAFQKGYKSRGSNHSAIRHFSFVYPGAGSPDVGVSWLKGSETASVTVGDTTTDDEHALEILKQFW